MKLLELLNIQHYRDCIVTMKIKACAAGGGETVEKALRNYYINSLTLKQGQKCVDNLVYSDWLQKSN